MTTRKADDLLKIEEFYLPFPFLLHEEAKSDMARFIALVNKAIDIPALGMCEMNRVIFFRHVHMCLQEEIEEQLFPSVIATIVMLFDMFGEKMEAIALGKASLYDLIQETSRELATAK